MVIMTGMDWILRSSTPVRSGHQSALTKALCNKRGGGEIYWLPRVNISKSLSLSFFHVCLHPSIISLSFTVWFASLRLNLCSLHPPSSPLLLSNHLFIADLFILYSSSLGAVHSVPVWCWFTYTGSHHHSFTPFPNPPLPPHHRRDTWGRAGSLWSNLTLYWFH